MKVFIEPMPASTAHFRSLGYSGRVTRARTLRRTQERRRAVDPAMFEQWTLRLLRRNLARRALCVSGTPSMVIDFTALNQRDPHPVLRGAPECGE